MKKLFLLIVLLLLLTVVITVSLKTKINKAQAESIQNVVELDKNSKEYKINQIAEILKGYEGKKQGNYARALLEKIREINDENEIKITSVSFQHEEKPIVAIYGEENYKGHMQTIIDTIDVDKEYEVKINNKESLIEVLINE